MNQWALEIRRKMETLFLADCIEIFRRYLRLLGGAPRFRSLREGISKATLYCRRRSMFVSFECLYRPWTDLPIHVSRIG